MKDHIIGEMKKIAQEQNITLKPITDDLALADFGFDSLCFAILVARLEDSLGVDPFATSDDIVFPVTVGDFVALYEKASVAA